MDDNKSPLSTPPSAQPVNPPPKPIDLTVPASPPASSTPAAVAPPIAQAEKLAHSPIKHDIAAPSPLPSEQPLPAPVPASTPEVVSATPAAPTSAPAPTPPSSIPPMPSLDSMAPAAATPVPSATPAPVPDSVINASTPVANSPTPPVGAEATQAPTVPTTTGEATSLVAESNTHQPTPQKKSKALVFVVIFLALAVLTLGGLVVWRAVQPTTRSIDESMTAPVVPSAQEAEEIIEEEVMVEEPDPTADWETYQNEEYSFKYPSGLTTDTGAAGAGFESIRVTQIGPTQQASGRTQTSLSDGFQFSVTKISEQGNISTQEQILKELENFTKSSETTCEKGTEHTPIIQTSINGVIAEQFSTEGCFSNSVISIIEHKNKLYSISQVFSRDPENMNNYLEITNQILSTFKFETENSTTPGSALQGSCIQDGVTYADGEAIPAPDSCNSCACNNGQIACTAMACEE